MTASAAASTVPLLEVQDLTVSFATRRGPVLANDGVSLSVMPGETLGIVGESGSGKSVFCRALLRLAKGEVSARRLAFEGRDLLALRESEMRRLRGSGIAMIFQSPMSSLDPVWTIGDQIAETLRLHQRLDRKGARAGAVALLDRVGIPSAQRRVDEYPHQWSGGMLQRAVIALALAGRPRLMLADEPTTALDVTIQDQILSLLLGLQQETGMALILVSHDMGVIAETCDRVAVMYAGRIVETAPVRQIFEAPAHPYTAGLLGSMVSAERATGRLEPITGQPPDLTRLGPGCAFAPRCSRARPACTQGPVPLQALAADHAAACLFPFAAGAAPQLEAAR
ncbi:ABC transporter ATP-binding protein [Labrys monachus]|uniref:Oligopeptide/dipeptide ABC transporter ATP-binding protein n=1 Tax=Labrys monachus TaxID=217067 RepID=A0ABU0FK06_9HYPH|nr:ABC transporter ATP-binding protein [Labrys monachus]MDQ0394816.1 oligopeptide/dipeptide ABC transporter ATP-binding protein [Labrys monachus]